MVVKESLKIKIFKYLNKHPLTRTKRLCKEFKENNEISVRAFYYAWKKEIVPLRWLYEFMSKKCVPVKKPTKAEKVRLRRIERSIGVE